MPAPQARASRATQYTPSDRSRGEIMETERIRFLVGTDGKATAVQVDLEVWRQIVAALEDAEDVALAQAALVELAAAGGYPEAAGWLRLEDVEPSWGNE